MDYHLRLSNLQKMLPNMKCDALLIEHPTNILYLTGLEISAGKLLVSAQAAALLVDGRYQEICSKQKLYSIFTLDDDALKSWLFEHAIKTLAFESETTTFFSYQNLKTVTDAFTVNTIQLVPLSSPVMSLRLIKDKQEIELLRKAATLCSDGYQSISQHLHPGITEEELATELEIFWKIKGAKKLSFDPIIAFGANGSMPHYRAGQTKLKKNTSILIDIGVAFQHYHSDMTRVIYFGEPPKEIRQIYTIVEEAKEKAQKLCRPGTLLGDLDKAARSHITSEGFGDFFDHSLGHGVGLEVHEPPRIRTQNEYAHIPLKAGMVITIEPGIYLPGIGGVRLEDTLLITEHGYENLTNKG
jgi:Xaa-Pro aminopeptidase